MGLFVGGVCHSLSPLRGLIGFLCESLIRIIGKNLFTNKDVDSATFRKNKEKYMRSRKGFLFSLTLVYRTLVEGKPIKKEET